MRTKKLCVYNNFRMVKYNFTEGTLLIPTMKNLYFLGYICIAFKIIAKDNKKDGLKMKE